MYGEYLIRGWFSREFEFRFIKFNISGRFDVKLGWGL